VRDVQALRERMRSERECRQLERGDPYRHKYRDHAMRERVRGQKNWKAAQLSCKARDGGKKDVLDGIREVRGTTNKAAKNRDANERLDAVEAPRFPGAWPSQATLDPKLGG
jgi:hypothetical protein